MDFLIGEFFFATIGGIILWPYMLFFPDQAGKLYVNKFGSSYVEAGKYFSLALVAVILIFGITALILAAIFSCLHHDLKLF